MKIDVVYTIVLRQCWFDYDANDVLSYEDRVFTVKKRNGQIEKMPDYQVCLSIPYARLHELNVQKLKSMSEELNKLHRNKG